MGRAKTTARKKGGHTEDSMRKAIELVNAGMSIRKASKECQLKYPTVRLYVERSKANAGGILRLTPNYEVNKIFTTEEEESLVEYIEYCAQLFYGLTSKDCRRVAYQMAKANNKKIPQSWVDAEMAGFEWLRSFRKRHQAISLRKPEACSLARATAFNRHNIGLFYGNLKSAMERHTSFADGTRLYNLDETSTTTVQRPGKVLARKGTNVAKVTSGERGTLVTTCCIVSAIGQALPPAMVFPRKKFQPHMLQGAPPGTLGLAAATGWMNAEIFVDVMKHFIKHVSASKENPALLIMDNHESHLSIEALELAKSSGVTILTLHPHTTAKLQPLDVGLNGPFKTYYNAAVDSWLLRNPGRPLTIYNIAECVGPAYLKAMTPVNIVNAFKKCGIFPFDDCIFTEADFMPSTVTDRPLIAPSNEAVDGLVGAEKIVLDSSDLREMYTDYTRINEQEIFCTSPSILQTEPASEGPYYLTTLSPTLNPTENCPHDVNWQLNPFTNRDNNITSRIIHTPHSPAQSSVRTQAESESFQPNPSTSRRNDLTPEATNLSALCPVFNQAENNCRNNIYFQPTPSTSRNFISPKEFMPPIKATPRDPKRHRAPGKSMIATDTPEKNAIEEKKKKKKGSKNPIKKAKQDLFKEHTIKNRSMKSKKKYYFTENNDSSDSDEEEFVASGSSSGGEDLMSENEADDGRIILDGNFLPLARDPKEQEFVIVLFPFKKTSVFYVAKILEIIDDNDEDSNFFVSFLRLKNRTRQTFCEPLVPDTAGIQVKDVKYILPKPKITGSSRRQASFSFDVHFNMTLLNLR